MELDQAESDLHNSRRE